MTKNNVIVRTYVLEKTTPGAVRYMEVDANGKQLKGDADGALAPTIYFRKAAMGAEVPQRLTIEIKVG